MEGERVIEKMEAEIIMNEKEIVQIDVKESTKALGAHIALSLS